jgi:hypothetical protein
MDQELPDSALSITLRTGEWLLWNGQPHRFESLKGERARIREPSSQRIHEVSVAELRGLPSLTLDELYSRLNRQRESRSEQWSTAERREDVIRTVMSGTHALMSATHPGATDRIAGPRQQDRQKARILPTSPAARTWIAERQQCWPEAYRRESWIELS